MANAGPSRGRSDEYPYPHSDSTWGSNSGSGSYTHTQSHSSFINCEVVASHRDATVRIVKDLPRSSGYDTPKAADSHPNTPNRRRNTFYSTFSTDSPRQQTTPDYEERGRSLSPPPADRRGSRYSSYSDSGRRPESDYYGRSNERSNDRSYDRSYDRRDRDYDRSYADEYDQRSEYDDRAPEDQYVRPPKEKKRGQKKKKDKEVFATHISKIVDGVIRGKWKDPYGYDEDSYEEGVGPESYKEVVRTRWSIIGTLIFLYYCAACIFYFVYRAKYTLNMGITWYGWIVLSIEMFTATSSLAYAVLLCKNTRSRFTDGLAPARRNKYGQYEPVIDERLKFHIRVLIPCYKETMELVRKTVMCALEAELPDNSRRTVYLCDDGNDPAKRDMIEELAAAGLDVAYVTGRERAKGEINGKSNNLNNVLINHIYKDVEDHTIIPDSECLVIFDADMCANNNFFLKVLEVMYDESVSLCLTPQAFDNINLAADIFNNSNLSFWEYILPGCDAVGYIACTGTNFCIRANALCECGWFPTYTITEDYALGMELKKRDRKAVYLNEYIAIGEAPEEIRNIFRQRSRWCKGQMQVLFSKNCPLFDTGLPFSMRLLYTSVTWCYVTNILAVPLGVLVPFVAIVIGYYPLTINFQFALASTLFYFANIFVVMYCTNVKHIKCMWFCSVSCHLLWFTYTKALFNVMIAKTGLKNTVFKATKKKGEDDKGKKRFCCTPENMGDLEGTKDAYVLFFSFFISFLTFLSGVYQISDDPNTAQGDFRYYLLLSVFWAMFNMIPPALFIFYIYNKGRTFEEFCSFCLVTSFALALGAVTCLWLVPNDYDFGQVLGLALQFYEIQHSGRLNYASNRHVWWRSDAFVNQTFRSDQGGYSGFVSSGYFDNFGFVKYTYTTAVTTAMLAWSLLEFPDGYKSSSNFEYAATHVNWGATYLDQSIIWQPNTNQTVVQALVAQIGDVKKDWDTSTWRRPESYTGTPLPAYFIDKTKPGKDLAASTAAGLAAAALALTGQNAKSEQYFNHAVAVYAWADSLGEGYYTYHGKVPTGNMYLSATMYDDMAWAAIWLHKACLVIKKPLFKSNPQILDGCNAYYAKAVTSYNIWVRAEVNPAQPVPTAQAQIKKWGSAAPLLSLNPFVFNYENVGWGAAMLIHRSTLQFSRKIQKQVNPSNIYNVHLNLFMDVWLGKKLRSATKGGAGSKWVSYTKRGMAYQNPYGIDTLDFNSWPTQGGLGNTMNAALLALLYAKYGMVKDSTNMQVKCWARGQVGYALGDGGRSYIVGYKPNYPTKTPHKAASCPGLPRPKTDTTPDLDECSFESVGVSDNAHTIYGGLVGGPRRDESFVDERNLNIDRNPFVAVTILNNAGFTATLAGLKHFNINLAKCEQGHGLIQNIRRKIKGTNDGEIWGSW